MIRLLPDGLPLGHPAVIVATWFYSGLLRPASGTWGSAAAIPFALVLVWLGGWPALLVAAILVAGIGIWVSGLIDRKSGVHDWGGIVIDEVAGMWLALIPAGLDWRLVLAAFILFRILDIAKPGPIGWLDRRIAGGIGVMADDLVSGIAAGVLVALLSWLTGWGWT